MKKFLAGIAVAITFIALLGFKIIDTERIKDAVFQPNLKLTQSELYCLTENIYFEAGNQPRIGKIAVAYVTINRTKSEKYPDNVCRVIWQRIGSCQFSWTCKAHILRKHPIDEKRWDESYEVANYIKRRYDASLDPTNGSLFYHANYVRPEWRMKLQKVVQIEDHIFYK